MENEEINTTPESQTSNETSFKTVEEAVAELKKVRQEAASRRVSEKELKEKAAKWEEYLESQKTELQKLQDQLAEKDKKLSGYELKDMKLGLLKEFELEDDDIDLLTGSDESTNRKIAERLKAKNDKSKEKKDTPRPVELLAGNRGKPVGTSENTVNFDDFIRGSVRRS